METGKTSKYIKYAIGEIILVMIGILLALQVNNWNQNRQLQKEELQILKGLHQEFNDNLNLFDDIYKKHLYRKKSIEVIMSVEVKELSLDSLTTLTNGVGGQWTFDPFKGIYNSVINSGKIDLISNDVLKFRISRFQDILKDYKEEEIMTNDFCANNLYPYVIDNLKLNFDISWTKKKISESEMEEFRSSLENILGSDKYENLLVYVYGYFSPVFEEGPILREEMESIINLLESEIEKHK
jgi:hypothetical protein